MKFDVKIERNVFCAIIDCFKSLKYLQTVVAQTQIAIILITSIRTPTHMAPISVLLCLTTLFVLIYHINNLLATNNVTNMCQDHVFCLTRIF